MDTTIDQQVAMDEARVPDARRLRIGRSNFCLLSDISSKESTLQLVYDVMPIVHHHSIQFKIDNKKHIVNLESFREMLHICLRLPGQSFVKPPFEEEIITFLHFLGHSGAIRKLTDVNINKLHQPWRSFATIINKCLTGKSSGYDSLRLNIKIQRRAMRCIILGSQRGDHMFTTIKLVSRHQNTQQFGALLPIELTNEDIRNSKAYKEYYAVATGATLPKPKVSVQKTRSSSDTIVTPPTVVAGLGLSTSAKGKQPATTSKAKNEGSGTIPGVTDVPTDESKEEISWNSTDEEGDDEGKDGDGDDEGNNGKERDDEDDDEQDDDEAQDDDDQEDEVNDKDDEEEETKDEEIFDPIPKIPENTDDKGNDKENLGTNVGREEGYDEEEEEDELYTDANINLGRGIQTTQEFKDSHVTLTPVNPDGQQQSSSVSSQFMTMAPLPVSAPTLTPLTIATITTTQQRMNEAVKVAVQIQSDRLRDEAQSENDEFLKTIDENMQKIIKEQALVEAYESDKIILDTYGDTVTLKRRRDDDADKDEEPLAGSDRGSKRRKEGKEPESASAPQEKATRSAGKSKQGYKSRHTSASESAIAEEPVHTTFEMEEPSHIEFETGADDQPIVEPSRHPEWFSQQKKPLTPDLDTLTPELLAGPTYELMKGSCKSLVELEFFLEEVYKATTDQLDWVNPKGQQYPHNLLKPLPLIPNSRGHHVIPFDHFINNDLKYLRGGATSCKYTTSVTKTKAADYGHIKWIEDLVPRTMWIQEPVGYDKHVLWGISHLGRKRQQFYGFAINYKSARDVYSKRRIIDVTEIKIVEWHIYKHLDWITMRQDDDKLYKFKEGDFKRLRIQYIEDMILLLV
nr:hypothetical protein [Tanacetum cinerariifolium]